MSEEMRTEKTAGVVKASTTMAVATVVSRGTGFVAKVVILTFLGFSITKDSYDLANTLPNIIFELLIGGVLTSVAIPLLSRARTDPDGGRRYTQQLMTLMIVGLTAATALAVAAAPLLTQLYMDSDSGTDPELATHFAYLLLPQIFFYGVAALFGAILNTEERFAAPAWAPVANNVVVIAVGVVLLATSATIEGGVTSLSRGQFLLLGLGTTAGIVVQAAIMLPALRRSGFRFGWQWGIDARMREAGGLVAWAIAYVLVSQAGYIVITRITTARHDGSLALYNHGSMLFQLPYGILGVSLLTAIMPRMSRNAAEGNMPAVKHDMTVANRLSAVALLPVSAAMIALALPLATVTSRYGAVTEADVRTLAVTLAAFAIGLLPLAITLVQMRVFYAMKDGRTPTLINAIMVAVRIPLLLACLALPPTWLVPGLAAAMSLSYLIGVIAGEIWLHARFGAMGFSATLDTIARTAIASAAGGVAGYYASLLVPGQSFVAAVGALVLGAVVGLAIVAIALVVLRVDEVVRLAARIPGLRRLSGSGGVAIPAVPSVDPTGIYDDMPAVLQAPPASWDDGQAEMRRERQVAVTDQPNTPAPGAVPYTPPVEPFGGATPGPGAVVGERYRLTRRVAVDAAGNEFWRARDTVLPRDMAVTILPATDPTSAAVTRTLRVGRLGHPGLPQTLDMGAVGTDAYVAGLWVDGATVTELLGDGPLEAPIARRIISSVAEAVRAVHQAGFALGAVHPSLIRVNAEGQIRFSHVISAPGAAPEDDIRAVGGLLYLMLTGTWPLARADGPEGAPAAPRRGDSPLSANKVVGSVPAALAKITDRALNPQQARGMDDLAELIELGAAATPQPGEGEPPTGTTGRGRTRPPREPRRASHGPNTADQRIMRDRRIKLSIAGAMLTALAVLIVIMGSSVVKQVLASIVEPINAADTQELVTAAPFTTTQSVGTTEHTEEGESGQSEEESTTAPSSEQKPLKISSASVFDPEGDGAKDYESTVDLTVDGDPTTEWMTWVYNQQFGPGGIKDGVGVMIKLAKSVSPSSVTVTSTSGSPGTGIEIRSATANTATLTDTTVLGSATLGADPVQISLDNAPKSKYLLVWISQLAKYQGDTPGNQGKFQSTIAEISITG